VYYKNNFNMKSYAVNSLFSFGKYEGKSLRDVLEIQPSYLNWCVINLDHFFLPEETIQEIQNIKPDFSLTNEAKNINDNKSISFEKEEDDVEDLGNYDNRDSYEDYTDWTHYNDNLDMDQQDIEFWNQF
jgi:hypothetical protein